jgi:hypothetical protein
MVTNLDVRFFSKTIGVIPFLEQIEIKSDYTLPYSFCFVIVLFQQVDKKLKK